METRRGSGAWGLPPRLCLESPGARPTPVLHPPGLGGQQLCRGSREQPPPGPEGLEGLGGHIPDRLKSAAGSSTLPRPRELQGPTVGSTFPFSCGRPRILSLDGICPRKRPSGRPRSALAWLHTFGDLSGSQ